MIQSWKLLDSIAPIFVMIAAGFVLRRARWLTADADRSLLRVTVNLLIPALIFDTMLGNPALQNIGNVLLAPVVSAVTLLLGFGVFLMAGRWMGLDTRTRRTFAFVGGVYNYSYIPIPIIQGLFSRETMGILFTFNLGIEITFWTVGILILTGSSGSKTWKLAFNAPVGAILISLALNFAHGSGVIPHFAMETLRALGASSVPLALLLTGATLADTIAATGLGGGKGISAAACILRLGVLPILFLLIGRYLPCSAELKRVIVIQAAMPAAMLPVVLTRHYGGESHTALHVVLPTTVVALATIPLWIKAGLFFVGV